MKCPECYQPMDKLCTDCGIFFDEPVFIVDEFTNAKPKTQKGYEKISHFKEVLGLFQGKDDI